ncbi:multidrug DMT transporter permease [Alginatibacterium sediminis]|uniref:Multidrug DMT transporter permease n=1 Tax=Alginatibacterium sediminis TaxID=2164068 RepID=A0A420EHI2_9ALTE|nr:YebG family protein [Alginatibacterium sediminis]RKF20117.1 multidrug DMT transporter permease [Alginatibacterium sediminis]
MAVIVKYVVERQGEEKMTFTSRKEADAYDKMLDVAEQLSKALKHAEPKLNENQLETLGFYLASHKEQILNLYKGAEFSPIADES